MMVVKATIPLNPDAREEALELMSEVSAKSREEDGIVDYRISVDVDDPNLVRVFEHYENEDVFASHMQKEHTQELVGQLPEFVGGEVEAIRFDVESVSELEM